MRYMLDTNAIIMAMKHRDWPIARKVIDHIGDDICISAITLGELEYGIKKSKDPSGSRRSVYQALAGIPVIPFDHKAAKDFGDIYGDLEIRSQRMSDRGTLIAAHARSMGLTVVTNNVKEFTRVNGLKVEDWSK